MILSFDVIFGFDELFQSYDEQTRSVDRTPQMYDEHLNPQIKSSKKIYKFHNKLIFNT